MRCAACWSNCFRPLPRRPIDLLLAVLLCRRVRCRECGRRAVRPLWVGLMPRPGEPQA